MYNPYSANQNPPDQHSPNGSNNPNTSSQPPGIPTQNSSNNGSGLNDFSNMSNALPNQYNQSSQNGTRGVAPIGPPGSQPTPIGQRPGAGAIGQPPGHSGNNSGGSGSSGGVGAIGQPPAANAPPGYNNMGPGGDQYNGPPSTQTQNSYSYGGGQPHQTGYNPNPNTGFGGAPTHNSYGSQGGHGYSGSQSDNYQSGGDNYGPSRGNPQRSYGNQGGYSMGGNQGYNPNRNNVQGGYNPHPRGNYGAPNPHQSYGPPGGYQGSDINYGATPGAIGQGPTYNPYSNTGNQYSSRAPGSGPIGPPGAIGGPPSNFDRNQNPGRAPPLSNDRYGASSVNSNPQDRDGSGSNINSPPFGRANNPDDSSISPPDMHSRAGRGALGGGDLSVPGGRSTHSNSSGDNVSTSGASGRGTMPTRPPTRPDQPASNVGDTPPESVAGSQISANRESSFKHPLRPSVGRQGKTIMLKANFFRVEMPNRDIYHYEVDVKPDKCPRRVNREIVNEMVKEYKDSVFANVMPVYDGRRNMYTTVQMPIERTGHTLDVKLPSDGRERQFQCTLKF